jgi:hypothetical protein
MFGYEFHNRGNLAFVIDAQDKAHVWSSNLDERDVCRRREGFPAFTSRGKNNC